MIATLLSLVVAIDPDQAVCRAILDWKTVAVAQFWTGPTKTQTAGNHLLCIDTKGRVVKKLEPNQSYAAIRVSADHRYVLVAKQRPASQKDSQFITEIPQYHTDITIYSSTEKVYERPSSGFRDGYWQGSALHYFSSEEVVVSGEGSAWTEQRIEGSQGVITKPASLGALIDFRTQEDKNATLSYPANGVRKIFNLVTQSPAEVVGLSGTTFFIYVDGLKGGVYQVNTSNGKNQRTTLPNFEWGAWLRASKSFAYIPLERPLNANYFQVRNWTTGKDRKITFPGRSMIQLAGFDTKRLLVSSYAKTGKLRTIFIDIVDSAGKRTPVWKQSWVDAPMISLMNCGDSL